MVAANPYERIRQNVRRASTSGRRCAAFCAHEALKHGRISDPLDAVRRSIAIMAASPEDESYILAAIAGATGSDVLARLRGVFDDAAQPEITECQRKDSNHHPR